MKKLYLLIILAIFGINIVFGQMMGRNVQSMEKITYEDYKLPTYVYKLIDDKILDSFFEKIKYKSYDEQIYILKKALDKIEYFRNKYNSLIILEVLSYIKLKLKEELYRLYGDFNPNARKIEVVELEDGDIYTMEISVIKKQLGNAYVKLLAYNGQIPGPLLKVKKGSTITIRLVNKVKGLETTLHSHGIRLDNKYDGVPIEMRGQQNPIKYGEVFEYKIFFKDEGIYWYHPHVREDVQQELGLYGNYLVEPLKRDFWSPVNREEILILDDILIEGTNIEPFFKEFANYVWMGRYGNIMLVNGQTSYSLNVKKGEVIRFYITNTANTRVFNLSIPGAYIKLVGSDLGKFEKEEYITDFIISPAERYIVEVYFPETGSYKLLHSTPYNTYELATFNVSDISIDKNYKKYFDTLRTNYDVIKDIGRYRKYFYKDPDKILSLTIGRKGKKGLSRNQIYSELGDDSVTMMKNTMMLNSYDGIEWEDTLPMNRISNSNILEWKIIDEHTNKENMNIDDWIFKRGDIVKIRIYNDSTTMHPMHHPIHFHGQRFLIISRNGNYNENLVWKDTVLIPIGEYVDILLEVTNPGEWMAHCHIAEHLSAGMMMTFRVE